MNRIFTNAARLKTIETLEHHMIDNQKRVVYTDMHGEMWLDYTTRVNFNPWTGAPCDACLKKTSEVIRDGGAQTQWE